MAIRSNIDVSVNGKIEGWVFNDKAPEERCEIIACIDKRVIATCIADIFREDLLQNGIGDGKHAFRLNLPPHILEKHSLHIFEKNDMIELVGSPLLPNISDDNHNSFILIDISDLLLYIEHHDYVTGIQRVQMNVVLSLFNSLLYPLDKIKIVRYNLSTQRFDEIEQGCIFNFLNEITKKREFRSFVRKQDNKLHVEEILSFKNLTLSERQYKNTIFLMLGASWVIPNYFLSIRKLKKLGVKFVPLLHDLIPIIMPKMCHKGTADVFNIFIRKLIRTADTILSVSQNTKQDVYSFCKQNNYDCPPIHVTKNGYTDFSEGNEIVECPVNEDFVLIVSTLEGRKNHILAVKIWETLYKEYGTQIPKLIFVGRLGWRIEELMETLRDSRFLDGKIQIFSDVSDAMLAALYQNCLFTIFPSFYEGWGLTVGESLMFGKVCLTSSTSSMQEVGGDLAVYFSPYDFEEGLDKTKKLIFDNDYRISIEKNIQKNFTPTTWNEVTCNILNAINSFNSDIQKYTYPALQAGEYSFAKIPLLKESAIASWEDILRFQKSALIDTQLSWDSYIISEELISQGTLFEAEDWGVWSEYPGCTLEFSINEPSPKGSHIIYLKIRTIKHPVTIELSHHNTPRGNIHIKNGEYILRILSEDFMLNNIINIGIKICTPPVKIENDERLLGIGLCAMAIVHKEDFSNRLAVLEKSMNKTPG